eukprot:64339_1
MATDSFLRNKQYQVQSTTNMESNIPSISPTKFPTMFPTDIQTTTTSTTPTKHPSIITLETTPIEAIDSYSSQNSNTLNKLLEHVTITWAIIAILISFVSVVVVVYVITTTKPSTKRRRKFNRK